MNVLEVTDLRAGYDDVAVLTDVTMRAEEGEITAILGTSGCGKTTLLKNIIGLEDPWSGSIKLFGQEVTDIDEWEFDLLRRRMGVLFQNGALLNSISVAENLAIPLEQHTDLSPALRQRIIRMKLDQVEMGAALIKLPAELSGGMRKRVALARALTLDPDLLFCDEPTAGLDPVTAAALDKLILDLRDQMGMSVVVITHSVPSVKRLADRIIFLEEGRVSFTGTIDEALSSKVEAVKLFFQEGVGEGKRRKRA